MFAFLHEQVSISYRREIFWDAIDKVCNWFKLRRSQHKEINAFTFTLGIRMCRLRQFHSFLFSLPLSLLIECTRNHFSLCVNNNVNQAALKWWFFTPNPHFIQTQNCNDFFFNAKQQLITHQTVDTFTRLTKTHARRKSADSALKSIFENHCVVRVYTNVATWWTTSHTKHGITLSVQHARTLSVSFVAHFFIYFHFISFHFDFYINNSLRIVCAKINCLQRQNRHQPNPSAVPRLICELHGVHWKLKKNATATFRSVPIESTWDFCFIFFPSCHFATQRMINN